MMNTNSITAGSIRQRKFLLVLPVLVIPFITLLFWALGGGKSSGAVAVGAGNGINMNLPDAYLKSGTGTDKMSYYDQAATDSAMLRDRLKNDPNYSTDAASFDSALAAHPDTARQAGSSAFPPGHLTGFAYSDGYNDPNEAKVYHKLEKLNRALESAGDPASGSDQDKTGTLGQPSVPSADIDRLEQLMRAGSQKTEDPEMGQMDGMLEKILDIQHPDRAQQKIMQMSAEKRGQVFAVSSDKVPVIASSLDKQKTNGLSVPAQPEQNGFYSFEQAGLPEVQNAIEAVVHENQTLISGSVVKFRLVVSVYINGMLIPRGSFVFGIATLSGERLSVKIGSIRYQQSLFPVALSVYDLDGLEGIYIPGAISRDVSKESTERGLQQVGFTSLDPSIGAQAAGVGLEAAKTLFSRKAKLVRVTVKAGYQVLLRDEKQKQ